MTDTSNAIAALTTHALLLHVEVLARVVGENVDAELTRAVDHTHPQSADVRDALADVRDALAKLDETLRVLRSLQERAMLPETTELERAEIGPEMVDAAIGAEAFAVAALTALLPLLAKPEALERTREAVHAAFMATTEFGTIYYAVLNAATDLKGDDPPPVVH